MNLNNLNKNSKILILATVLLFMVFYIIFTAKKSGVTNPKLSDDYKKIEFTEDFNKKEIEKEATEIVNLLSVSDYEAISEKSVNELKEMIENKDENTVSQINKIKDAMKDIGKIEKITMTDPECYKVKATEQEFALISSKIKYENGKAQFILFISKDNKLMGFQVK